MKKGTNQWVCSDRELRLRSKLDVGWSAKSSKFRTAASNSKDEMERSSNTSTNQLTSYEQGLILNVLKRSKQIDQMEENRINKLLERLKTMKKSAKGDGNESCAFCSNQFTFSFFNFSYKVCNDCNKYICKKCCITNLSSDKKKLTLCKLCSETREMWKKSGAWFFNNSFHNYRYNLSFTLQNNQSISDTNEKAADLITDSMHRRASSELSYYEIINNNKFELSPQSSRRQFLEQSGVEASSSSNKGSDQQQTIDEHHLLNEKEADKSTDKPIQQDQQNREEDNSKFNNALIYQNLVSRKLNKNDDGNQRFETTTNRMNETANKSTKNDGRLNENAGNQIINLNQNAYLAYSNPNGSNSIGYTCSGVNNSYRNSLVNNNYLQPSYQHQNQSSYDSRSSLSEASTPDTVVYNSINSISSTQTSTQSLITNAGSSLAASSNQLKASSPISQASQSDFIPDRFRNQNSLAPNSQNLFYYSLPTTPSCPMKSLNQHHSNQQYANQYHPTNPFIQNNLQPNYLAPQNQMRGSSNLINSLCSPVKMSNKTNPFMNRNLQINSTNYVINNMHTNQYINTNQISNHYKASSSSLANQLTNSLANNLSDNQLMSTINQTNLVNLNKQSNLASSLNSNDLVALNAQSIQTNFTNSNYLMVDKTKYLN